MDVEQERSDHATGPSEPEAPRAPAATWLLSAAMAALALALTLPGVLDDPAAAVPGLWWVALLPLFALAEVVVIHLPTQRNAHGHTLREIPAVLGLTFLAPEQYVTAYVVGAVLALVVAARMRGIKLAFNSAMFALEAALGALTYHAILGGADPLSLLGWVAVLIAVLVTDLMSAAAVTAAISLSEGAFDGEVLREAMVSGSVAAFVNTCMALLVALLVLVRPTALPLLGVVVVLWALGYRVYITLARGHAQTRLLYRFVDRTSAATTSSEIAGIVLRETADLMHAERAFLVEVTGQDQVRCLQLRGGQLHSGALEPEAAASEWWWRALGDGVVQFERSRAVRSELHESSVPHGSMAAPRDGIAARLGAAGTPGHVLVVCDRSFEKETFSDEDSEVFEALASHAGVVMERARTISELETLAGELAMARDSALAASEAKSLFLANMSHELRTPLTTVLATAEMLEDTGLDAEQAGLVERMQRCGESLRSLVESILDFSRIEAGRVTLSARPFDLHAVLAEVCDAHRARATRGGVDLSLDASPLLPREVEGDRGRLFQVLDNLVGNAVKFTHDGEVRLAAQPSSTDGVIELAVSDTGIGIAAGDQATIFGVFSQVDPSATRRYEGTGLGLAICKQLTELMGGELTVESEPGVGSTFTVRLPLATASTEPVGGTSEPARPLIATSAPAAPST